MYQLMPRIFLHWPLTLSLHCPHNSQQSSGFPLTYRRTAWVCVTCGGSNWAERWNPTHLPIGNTTRQRHLNESLRISSTHSHSFSPFSNMYTHPLPFSPSLLSGILVASSLPPSETTHHSDPHNCGQARFHNKSNENYCYYKLTI